MAKRYSRLRRSTGAVGAQLAAAVAFGAASFASASAIAADAATSCDDFRVKALVIEHLAGRKRSSDEGVTLIKKPNLESGGRVADRSTSPFAAVVTLPYTGKQAVVTVNSESTKTGSVLICEYKRAPGSSWQHLDLEEVIPTTKARIGRVAKGKAIKATLPAGTGMRFAVAVVQRGETGKGISMSLAVSGEATEPEKDAVGAIPSSVSAERRRVLEAALAMYSAAKSKRGSAAQNEKTLYYPRRCTGFVLDAFSKAGLWDSKYFSFGDYNGSQKERTRALSKSDGVATASTPNVNVTYLENAYCGGGEKGTDKKTGLTYGCAHPFQRDYRSLEVEPKDVQPGDLWVGDLNNSKHVGIVLDPQKKLFIHNAVSTGPTISSYADKYYTKFSVTFLRHERFVTKDSSPAPIVKAPALPASLDARRKALIDAALGIRTRGMGYKPRLCTGFVIDAFNSAKLWNPTWFSRPDYSASPSKPNVNVTYLVNGYCDPTKNAHCDHPFQLGGRSNLVSANAVQAGDLWVGREKNAKAYSHVGIVVDPKAKTFLHNSTSRGVILDNYGSSYWQKWDVLFLRHADFMSGSSQPITTTTTEKKPTTLVPPVTLTSLPSVGSVSEFGVDRGKAFSAIAVKNMTAVNVESNGTFSVHANTGRCLSAVKRALIEAKSIGPDGTVSAKDFAAVMSDPKKVTGYKPLAARYSYTDLPKLRDKLPVGTIIVYRANDESAGFSLKHGHIDMVAEYNGRKSLMSGSISKWSDGWGWLGGSTARNVDMWIFVPTKP